MLRLYRLRSNSHLLARKEGSLVVFVVWTMFML